MTFLGAFQMFLLAAIAFLALSGVLASALVPFVVRWTEAWAPASRHRALALLAASPFVLSAAALLSVVLPSLLGSVWPGLDHCHVHGGHFHLCFVHPSDHAGSLAGWTAVAAAAALMLGGLWRGARELVRAQRALRNLERVAAHDPIHGLWTVPTERPLCISAGLLKPRLLISSGLLLTTTELELGVITAHERAHARRKDSLVRMTVSVAARLLRREARVALLGAFDLAAEQACDEAAAQQTGDRLGVAETLLAIERRFAAATLEPSNALVAGIGSSSLPRRVEAMLLPARRMSALHSMVAILFAVVLGVLGSFDLVHHATESVLAPFSH